MCLLNQSRAWIATICGSCLFLVSAGYAWNLHAGEHEPPRALGFDGSRDGVEIPNTRHDYQHLIEGEGTIEFWCKISLLRTGRNQSYRQFAVSFSGSIQSRDRDINIGINEGGNWWIVMSDTNNYILQTGYSYSEESLAEDKWYHVAVVMGGEDRGFYLNGEKKDTWDEFSGETGAWERNLHIGYTPSENRHWHGMLSEVRIWDRNLSAEDIHAQMYAGLKGDEDGLAGYWPLDDVIGSRARDLAGGRDGKLIGNPGRLVSFGDIYNVVLAEPGDTVTLAPAGAADHEGKARYRWYFGNRRLEGERDDTLVLSDVSEQDFGAYFLVDWSGTARVLGVIFVTDDSAFEMDDQQEVTPVRSREVSLIPEDFSDFYEGVVEQIDVGPAWSVHRIGSPRLLTRDGVQYVAYYDDERYIRLARRELGSSEWSYHTFPVQMGWATGGHANFALALDRDGYIHMCAYRRDLQRGPSSPPRKIYYRSKNPHCIEDFERLYMVSESELPDYPTFLLGSDEELYFEYRAGTSGAGNHVYNIYDPDSRSWERAHEGPFFDGQGRMNAYGFPRLRQDGNWHVVWCWRNTPDNATNHSPSYARGEDMRNWQTAGGEPIDLPITIETDGVVFDPDAGVGDGISNMTTGGLSFDSEGRPVISYHKFDEAGNSQIYNARFEGDRWRRVQATDWDFRWNYSGSGALPRVVRTGSVSQAEEGVLEHIVWNRHSGEELIILDEESLEPIRRTYDLSEAQTRQPPSEWEVVMKHPELDFEVAARLGRLDTGRMEVNLIGPYLEWPDETEEGVRYLLRWEHGGGNRDRPVARPWPEATMLRVYKIRDQ